jgi:hypothetical protein
MDAIYIITFAIIYYTLKVMQCTVLGHRLYIVVYVSVSIKSTTSSTVGVQTVEGEYLIVNPTWSKTIEAAGTTITYIHEDNKYLDRIYIPGPTQYEINLVVCFCTIQHANEQLLKFVVFFRK